MIDFVKTLWAFVKERGYIRCERCGLSWSLTSYYKMSKEDRERLREGRGCKLCKSEYWRDGKYLGDKEWMK